MEQFKKSYDTARKDFEKVVEDNKQIQKEIERLNYDIHEKQTECDHHEKEKRILNRETEDVKTKFNDQSKYNENLDKINTDLQNTLTKLDKQLAASNQK